MCKILSTMPGRAKHLIKSDHNDKENKVTLQSESETIVALKNSF